MQKRKKPDPLYKSNTVEPLILAEPFARHRMEPSFEAAQLPARLLRAVGAAAEARQPKSGGDGGAVDPAGTAHDETLRFSDTVAGVRLDSADHAALARLVLQRRQRSQ